MTIRITVRKYMGDDLYSWAVFASNQSSPIATGMSQSEAKYHARQIARMFREKGHNVTGAYSNGAQ